jgi:hypothetical protein
MGHGVPPRQFMAQIMTQILLDAKAFSRTLADCQKQKPLILKVFLF